MKTIAQLRTRLNDILDSLAATYGETTDISSSQTSMDAVSHGVDAQNETWNPNLPPRPH